MANTAHDRVHWYEAADESVPEVGGGHSLFGRIDARQQQLRRTGVKVKNAAIGEPPFPPPALFRTALHEAVERVEHNFYPDPRGSVELRLAIAAHFARRFRGPYDIALDPAAEVLVC